MEPAPQYADVALPVPLDRAFTYSLPETLRHRVKAGCRVLVPFGTRKLTGVVLGVHTDEPDVPARDLLRLLDEEPVLELHLIELARWIAHYYCAPIGEVLRVMTPLAGEVRHTKIWSLTDRGIEVARQLVIGAAEEDTSNKLLQLLAARPLSATYLAQKVPNAARLLQSLAKKGYVAAEDVQSDRDPLRAAADRLTVEYSGRPPEGAKLRKIERELLSYLELFPGAHNLAEIETKVDRAAEAARALARRKLLNLRIELTAPRTLAESAPLVLNEDQAATLAALTGALDTREFRAFLLHGVTGSGKTEVYMRAIEHTLALGRAALLLVPEIALTPAVASQFFRRFGDTVAILHSAFHDMERAEQWRRIRNGVARVVVGTRSAVFAPVQDLGLVIVDEEHDGSYKQQETPRYNGRDVAVVRAHAAGACIVAGSATPSLESRYNVERAKYTLLTMPERVQRRPLPTVELIDMRQEFLETRKQATFSRRLLEAMQQRLEGGEQVMLLHNRRGFASFAACRACGHRLECINCAVTLTWHRRDRRMLCHYCDYAERVPNACPKCGSEYLQFLGTGSERVEDELHREFPEARIARLDRDTVAGKRNFEEILHRFREGSYDILVGTQMIAKGHDIPNVTLVGVISADIGLGVPDFRAAERTFQLLTQVAGRAGRGDMPGRVLVQTINPDHYAIRLAAAQDFDAFYRQELQFRRALRYPPFSALANILVRSEKQEDALRISGEIAHELTPPPEGLKLIGPAEAPVPRLMNEFRYQLLIKAANRRTLNETLHGLRTIAVDRKWPANGLVIDVDPLSLM